MDDEEQKLFGSEEQRTDLAAPFVESGRAIWVAKARQYNIEARKAERGLKNDCSIGFFNIIGSLVIALDFILKSDTFLGCGITIICTLLYYKYAQHLTVSMSWNVISFGIIFPITRAIGMGFTRREEALKNFGQLTGHLRALWGGIHTWRAKNKEKGWVRVIELIGDDPKHTRQELRLVFDEFLTALITYFDTVRWKRTRHVLRCLAYEQTELEDIAHEQRIHIDASIGRLQRLIQDLKVHGLPGGEAHRLDQYLSKITISIENLAALKEYRTPQAFGAFARIYIQLLGALYGPYFLVIASGLSKSESNIIFAILFALSIQLTMSGLYHVMLGLEDPFAGGGGGGASNNKGHGESAEKMSTKSKMKKRMSTARVPEVSEMTGQKGNLDSVNVPELVDMTRRMLLQVEEDAAADWRTGFYEAEELGY